jgi:hypothetical protein
MRRIGWVVLPAVALAACGEGRVAGPTRDGAAPAGMYVQGEVCTHRWAAPISGDWSDPAMWDVGTVPGASSVVCIDAPGTYRVDTQWLNSLEVDGLVLGDGVSQISLFVFLSGPGDVEIADELLIRPNAMLSITEAMSVGGTIRVEGELKTTGDVAAEAIVTAPDGVVYVNATTSWQLSGSTPFVNEGYLGVNPSGTTLTIEAPNGGTVRMMGGWMGPSGTAGPETGVEIFPGGSTALDFEWTGGRLTSRDDDTTRAYVTLRRTSLRLGAVQVDTAPRRGQVDLEPEDAAVSVVGDVDSPVHVRVTKRQAGATPTLELAGTSGGPLVNYGQLDLLSESGVLPVGGGVVNRSRMILGPGRVDLMLDSLANRGTLGVGDSTRFVQSGGVLRNEGTVTGIGTLVMSGSAFVATSAATMSARLGLEAGGRLTGTGVLRGVTSLGGIVDPAGPVGSFPLNTSALGSLSLMSLVLDGGSRVIVDVAGQGQTDQISVVGIAKYAGTLEARALAGTSFTPGRCGQVFPVISNVLGLQSGAFTRFAGFKLATTRAWRLHTTRNLVALAGHDPSTPMGVSPTSLTVAEGGASKSVDLCLGRNAPTADVVVTPVASDWQLYYEPGPWSTPQTLTFTPADWALPKRVTISAFADGASEGPMTDVMRFTLASADPAYGGAAASELPVHIVDIDPGPDLALSVVSAPTAAALYDTVDVTYRVTNLGPRSSSGSTFTITPLTGLVYMSSGADITCASVSSKLTCTLGSLAAGAQQDVTVRFRTLGLGPHAHTVSIEGNQHDGVAANDTQVWTLTTQ